MIRPGCESIADLKDFSAPLGPFFHVIVKIKFNLFLMEVFTKHITRLQKQLSSFMIAGSAETTAETDLGSVSKFLSNAQRI